MEIKLRRGFAVLTLVFGGGIYWLSSIPYSGVRDASPLRELATNLLHIPIFGGLAICFFLPLLGEKENPWIVYLLTLLATSSYAVFDEWHQSLVPGHYPSVNDILLDLVGVVGMLVIFRLGSFSRVLNTCQSS